MAEPVPISLGLRSNPARQSKQAGNARLINCFAEEIGEEGKSQWLITATAGLSTFGSALDADGGIRDMIEVDGYLYVVAGRQVFKVDSSGLSTLLGGIPTDGPVYMRRNRRSPTQIGIVTDGLFYTIDVSTATLSVVSDTDLPPPSSLAYLDGYGILPIAGGRYMITSIDDFTAIDALDEGSAESNPDPIVRAHELGREVYLFGTQSTEAHQNTGNADFPLERSQTMEVGCAAADSVCAVDTPSSKGLMFVAHDHTVRVLSGYQTQVVSTGEIENKIRLLAEAGTINTLRATSWSWGGRFFYALSCADWTRCYDAKTGLWHERASYLSDRWRVSKVTAFAGKLVAGDATTGQLYLMNDDVYTEGSSAHVLQIIAPPVHAFPYRGIANALYVDAVSGVGLNTTTAHNLDPVLMIDLSKDGGDTFGTPRELPLHRQGQTARRIQPIRRLGRFGQKGLTIRARASAAVQKVLLSMALDYDRLAA
jgi:hypothetical protein